MAEYRGLAVLALQEMTTIKKPAEAGFFIFFVEYEAYLLDAHANDIAGRICVCC